MADKAPVVTIIVTPDEMVLHEAIHDASERGGGGVQVIGESAGAQAGFGAEVKEGTELRYRQPEFGPSLEATRVGPSKEATEEAERLLAEVIFSRH